MKDDKYLDYMLVNFEQNGIVNYTKLDFLDKKQGFLKPFGQNLDAI